MDLLNQPFYIPAKWRMSSSLAMAYACAYCGFAENPHVPYSLAWVAWEEGIRDSKY